MKKLMIILPSMNVGGSERVISTLVNHLDKEKYEITLVLLTKEGEYLQDLPNSIKIIDLEVIQARKAILKIIYLIRKTKPDIVLSTLGYLNLLISIIRPFFSKKIKFVARESSIVSINNKQEASPGLFDWLFRTFYNNFDTIISQSYYMKQDLVENYNIEEQKIKVINNPVDIEKIHARLQDNEKVIVNKNRVNLLAVGRLSPEKGFDLLLRALNKLDTQYYLTIVGEGDEKDKLIQLLQELQIKERVNFVGFQENPYQYMQQSDMLVLSSKYEGFPNVALEANTCGIPIVAFDCPGGTREIIENGLNGFLVECGNIDKLKNTIQDAAAYNWNHEMIIQQIKNKYSVKTIIDEYEKVLFC